MEVAIANASPSPRNAAASSSVPSDQRGAQTIEYNDIKVLNQNLSVAIESNDQALISQAWQAITAA